MKELIEALNIFLKYQNKRNPTYCNHDVLTIVDITRDEVSESDQARLQELGFIWSEHDGGCWISFRYGNA